MTVDLGVPGLRAAAGFEPFWDGLVAHELRLPRCVACGHWQWYPTASCDECGSLRFTWPPVRPAGRLFTWTVVHRPFVAGSHPPYTTGLVTLDGAPGVRLVCRIAGDPAGLRIDAAVRAVWRDDPPYLSFGMFSPGGD
jgi:uncharacterized OB-fold protein